MVQEIWLIHHSHTDIGFTHPQPIVFELHRRYIDDVLELIWQSRRQNAGITCGADYIYHDEIGQPVF